MINSGEDSSCLYIDDLDISIPKHYIAHPEDYLDFIARGSFANVYSFSDSKKKETCAIKIGKEEKDEKFTKDEIAIHRTLNHPNIVRYYLAYHCNQAKDYQQGLFKEKILRPLLKRIKSRDQAKRFWYNLEKSLCAFFYLKRTPGLLSFAERSN
ncbi:hypothetical protein ACHWQZ_G008217 [Mnemiopsis leidyi]